MTRSITDLAPFAIYRDGRPWAWQPRGNKGGGHALLVGRTRSGKTHSMGMLLAQAAHAPDAVMPCIFDIENMCADFRWDRNLSPADDEQGFGFDRLGIQMVDDIAMVGYRLEQLLELKTLRARGALPRSFDVIIPVDEFASILETTAAAGDVFSRVARASLSQRLTLLLGAQRATSGFIPPAVKANLAYKIAFTVSDEAEARYIFGERSKVGEALKALPGRSGLGYCLTPDVGAASPFRTLTASRGAIRTAVAGGFMQPSLEQLLAGWDGDRPDRGRIRVGENVTGGVNARAREDRWVFPPVEPRLPTPFTHLDVDVCPPGEPGSVNVVIPVDDQPVVRLTSALWMMGEARLGPLRQRAGLSDRQAGFAVERAVTAGLAVVVRSVSHGSKSLPVYGLTSGCRAQLDVWMGSGAAVGG